MVLATKEEVIKLIEDSDIFTISGHLIRIKGLLLECSGHAVSVGDLCYIESDSKRIPGEVIGFDKDRVQIMPFESIIGLKAGDKVRYTNQKLSIGVGSDLLGRVIDPLGNPIDFKGDFFFDQRNSVFSSPINPMARPLLQTPLSTGVRVIDGFLPIAEGQRIGIFAGTGVGKSSLIGMIAHNSSSDINVIALIGERGREVREFIENELGEEGLSRSVIITSTSDTTPLSRFRGAYTALAVAEYFRDQGKKVMLLFDSVTRFANAQREIGLSLGEPPSSRGYPPSVFALLPSILERCGSLDKGSITGVFTVLTEGDDLDEPVSDAIRGILDGHIVLDRKIAEQGIYPSVSVLSSVSRLSGKLLSEERQKKLIRIRSLLALYRESEDLIKAGIYARGSNPEIDLAISLKKEFDKFVSQGIYEKINDEEVYLKIDELYAKVAR